MAIVGRATGLGLLSGAAAGALLGWLVLLFHPIGLAFGAVAGLPYGLVGGLAVGLAVAWSARNERGMRLPAALAATTPSLVALVVLLSSTMDREWILFLVVIPAAAGAVLAFLQAGLIAGLPHEERLRPSQRPLPPGPLAGPWDPPG